MQYRSHSKGFYFLSENEDRLKWSIRMSQFMKAVSCRCALHIEAWTCLQVPVVTIAQSEHVEERRVEELQQWLVAHAKSSLKGAIAA